jgi:putative transposase
VRICIEALGLDCPCFADELVGGETPLNLALMRLVDEQFLQTPWYGSRQMTRHLRREGYGVGRKRVQRLMAGMGLASIYQRPRTTVPHPQHRVWP